MAALLKALRVLSLLSNLSKNRNSLVEIMIAMAAVFLILTTMVAYLLLTPLAALEIFFSAPDLEQVGTIQTQNGFGFLSQWPSDYEFITSPFGMRIHPVTHIEKMHTGVDIGAPMGDEIRAAGAGTVLVAEISDVYGSDYGILVVLEHGGGYRTMYAHMSEAKVQAGDLVSAGELLGLVGDTGKTTGAHLHFEIRLDGVSLDPLSFYRKQT
jgi:murein DD-endopeptidase MepM/ murein hydrolase activator NlpD